MEIKMNYDIEIAEFNSAGIREVAAEIGATRMRKIATGSFDTGSGEVGATLYAIPDGSGEIRVLDTNADPIFEDADPCAFAEALECYGIAE